MRLDENEKLLIEKIVAALRLVEASEADIHEVSIAKQVDATFLNKAGKFFENTDACDVCRHAFYGWRHTLDDETVFSFLDDWINWKRLNRTSNTKSSI